MNGKLLVGVIALMLLVNGILITVALRKKSVTPPPSPAQIIRETPAAEPITENSSKLKTVSKEIPPTKLENCFNYYNYGNIHVNLSSKQAEYTNQKTIKLTGSIVNDNTFPIADVVLYAHVKRINTTTFDTNGQYLIDTLPLLEHLNFQARETKHVDVEIPIKQQYPAGNYQIQYFVFSKYGFHYGGRPFFEEDTAGSTNLSLQTSELPSVYFDLNTVQAAGKARQIRGITEEFNEETIPFDLRIIDTRSDKTPITVSIKFYNFEDTFASNLVRQQTVVVDNTAQPIHIEFTPPEQAAYVLVAEIDTPVRSMLKYRFGALTGSKPKLRVNDLGVSSFPATKDGRAWVCFHSPARDATDRTSITLSLLNDKKELISENSVSYAISPDVLAISVPLDKLTSPNNFSVKATVGDTIQGHRDIQLDYSCNMFSNSTDDFTLSHTNNHPYELTVSANNTCGEEIHEGKINNIRIVQNGKIIKETTNILTLPYTFSFKGIPAGSYTAQVKMGERVKEIPIEIPGDSISTQPKQEKFPILYSVLAGIAVVILVLIFIIIRMRTKSSL